MAPIIFLLNRTDLKNLEKGQEGKPGERNKRARFNEAVSISDKAKSWFFEKIHKTDIPLLRQFKGKKQRRDK